MLKSKVLFHKKLKDSKFVESYSVTKYDSGIYCVLFNTKKRWIPIFGQNSDEQFYFNENIHERDNADETITIKQFRPENESFVITMNQCKDQIGFYYIPFKLLKD
jgi:hypothetical protein